MVFLYTQIKENVNGRLGFASAVMMLSQINFGMDLVAFANTQAMPAFNKKFGAYNAKLERYALDPYFLSLLNSLTYVGQVFGVITGGWIARRWGRRVSFWVMSIWAIISAILLVTAQSKEQVLVGRICNYIYLGQELVTVPVYQAEIAPPKVRGMVIGTFQLGTMVRLFLIAGKPSTA
jgi:MFS transporter, SP family, sugar:H+ symporter